MNKIQVSIRGKRFNMTTPESPERIEELAMELELKIEEFAAAMRGRGEVDIAILAAFDALRQREEAADKGAKELREVRAELDKQRGTVEGLLEKCKGFNAKIQELERAAEEQKKTIAERDFRIDALTAELEARSSDADSSAKVAELEQALAAKSEECGKLSAKIEEQDVQYKLLQHELRTSAESELFQLARVRQEESDELRAKLLEYESAYEGQAAKNTDEINANAQNEIARILELKDKETRELTEKLAEFAKMRDEENARRDSREEKLFNSAAEEFRHVAKMQEQRIAELREKLATHEKSLEEYISRERADASTELAHIAAAKEIENADLIAKLLEYEGDWNSHAMKIFDSAITEYKDAAVNADEENKKLTEMLENFERMFADSMANKEREILFLQEEIERMRLKIAETADDGQLSLVQL